MKNKILLIIPAFLLVMQSYCQDFTPLLEKAWANNELLQSHNETINAATFAAKEAKALYGPTIKFNTVYTLAAGGRTIQFPVGDLLNPVYSTLNQLTQSSSFPQLENQNVNFLPNNFYDAKFRVEQPIFYPELAINKSLKEGELEIKSLDVKIAKRAVAREVMLTYFQLKQAETYSNVLAESGKLLDEAARTTASMVANGIALPSTKIRVEAQRQALQQQVIEAENSITNARAYLRQLLGSELVDSVNLDELPAIPLTTAGIREELLQLEKASDLMSLAIKKEDLFYKPKLGAALDAGSQAFNFGWSPYVLLGINLDINLYDHKRHQYRKDQAKANIMANDLKKSYVTEQLSLKQEVSKNNLMAALRQAATFDTRIKSAERNFKDVSIKYREGIAGYLELLDAENLLTTTRLQYTLARFNAWAKWADFQYYMATVDVNN